MNLDPVAFGSAITLFRQGLGLLKDLKELIPDRKGRAEVARALESAEKQMKIAEAAAAKEFGYVLCKCEFPPPIMLLTGESNTLFKCPHCERTRETKAASVSSEPVRRKRWLADLDRY